MPKPMTEVELTSIFTQLGAPSPESWARSEIQEGIPQLMRYLFLQNAWHAVKTEGASAWIDEEIASGESHQDAPYAGLGQALARMRAQGVPDDNLTTVARCLQAQMIFSLGYLMDAGPWTSNAVPNSVNWGLFEIDEDAKPFGRMIGGLHESVLKLDPTGREMRPKPGSSVAAK